MLQNNIIYYVIMLCVCHNDILFNISGPLENGNTHAHNHGSEVMIISGCVEDASSVVSVIS